MCVVIDQIQLIYSYLSIPYLKGQLFVGHFYNVFCIFQPSHSSLSPKLYTSHPRSFLNCTHHTLVPRRPDINLSGSISTSSTKIPSLPAQELLLNCSIELLIPFDLKIGTSPSLAIPMQRSIQLSGLPSNSNSNIQMLIVVPLPSFNAQLLFIHCRHQIQSGSFQIRYHIPFPLYLNF